MSALPQSGHLQCKGHVRFVPIADIGSPRFQRNQLGRPRGHRSHHLILFGADL